MPGVVWEVGMPFACGSVLLPELLGSKRGLWVALTTRLPSPSIPIKETNEKQRDLFSVVAVGTRKG